MKNKSKRIPSGRAHTKQRNQKVLKEFHKKRPGLTPRPDAYKQSHKPAKKQKSKTVSKGSGLTTLSCPKGRKTNSVGTSKQKHDKVSKTQLKVKLKPRRIKK